MTMDEYTHYGTPLRELDDEEAPKKFQDDTVRDDRGRRRFHGAFTGGFSAGYFNSVGTKDGWTPQNFVSSRSKRADSTSGQRPEDFMDNEDLGEMGIAPQRVQLREGVRTQDGRDSKVPFEETYSRTAGVGSQRELLQAPLIRLLATDTESVGVRILRTMGWRPGRGLGPTVCLKASYGPQLLENISETVEIGPEEVVDDILQAIGAARGGKDNVWGLGYSPAQRLNLFGERIDRERVTMSTATVEGRRVGIRGQAFGVGAFEEDDEDIYARDDMTQYDFEEVDHRIATKRDSSRQNQHTMIEAKRPQTKGGVIDGFLIADAPETVRTVCQISRVEIPPGWTPRATMLAVAAQIMKSDLDSDRQTGPSKEMSRDDKVALISDRTQGSVFDLISAEDKVRIEAARRAIQSRDSSTHTKKTGPAESTRSVVLPPSAQGDGADEDADADIEAHNEPTEEKPALSKVDIESLTPFASNPAKQERFERYIRFAELGHREMLPSIQPPAMSQWEAALEKKEFESTLLLVRPQLGLSNRFEKKAHGAGDSNLPIGLHSSKDIAAVQSVISEEKRAQGPSIRPLKEFGKDTHGEAEWHPQALLCKRFNVPNPYPGDETIGIPLAATSSLSKVPAASAEDLGTESVDVQQPSSSTSSIVNIEKPKPLPPKPASSSILGSFSVKRFEDLIEEEEAKTPPPADLFKFIFSDDEDDDEDAQDQNRDGDNSSATIATDANALIPSTSEDQSPSRADGTKQEATSRDSATTKKSSGLFADLDLSLLSKRPPPKPIQPIAQASRQPEDEEAVLLPMGPKPPPVIPVVRTALVQKDSKRHYHDRSHSAKGEKRKKDSKKIKREKKKKKSKKADSKKSKKHKKEKSSLSSSSSRKRKRRQRETDSSDQDAASESSTDESVDSDATGSDSDEERGRTGERDLDQRLREKLRKLKS